MPMLTVLLRQILRWMAILAILYASLIAFLSLRQDSLIFFPQRTTPEKVHTLSVILGAETVSIRANDGTDLKGYFLGHSSDTPLPAVIFFGGNAMQGASILPLLSLIRDEGANILLVDYRGYGLSGGTPSAATMKTDAEKIFDAAVSHPQVDDKKIIVWGQSIGTGVATHLASVKPVAGIILFSPFISLADTAYNSLPFIPRPLIRTLLRHSFDNLALAPSLTQPTLIVHGEQDSIESPESSKRLAEALGGPTELLIAPKLDHDNLLMSNDVWNAVIEFLISHS